MNNTAYVYLAVTFATLIFCTILLLFTQDQGTHYAAIILAGLAAGHWFGYSNQLMSSLPVPLPVPVPTQEPPKQA